MLELVDWAEASVNLTDELSLISSPYTFVCTCIKLALSFQSRGVGLTKQINDLYEQVEQSHTEKETFRSLREHELRAIPKRLEVSSIDFTIATLPMKFVINASKLSSMKLKVTLESELKLRKVDYSLY